MGLGDLAGQAIDVYDEEGFDTLVKDAKMFLTHYAEQSYPAYWLSKRQIDRIIRQEANLDELLDTVLDLQPGYGMYKLSALQLRDELAELVSLVEMHEPATILEIGTAHGGTLYMWARYVDSTSRIVSLDIPGRTFAGGYRERKKDIFRRFSTGEELSFVWQSSHLDSTYQRIRGDILDEGESVDFLFIDGDHTYEGVKQDFEMYQDLVGDDGLIAFHDIVEHPVDPSVVEHRRETTDAEERHLRWNEGHLHCNVDDLWEEIREEYQTREIISHPDQTWGGIGVVYL